MFVEDVGLSAGLVSVDPVITTEVLCNNNRRKDLLTEPFLIAVILPLLVFQILLSNLLACLTWY